MSVQPTTSTNLYPVAQTTQSSTARNNRSPTLLSKITTVALSAIALFVLANIPGANAGPMAYALCVEACFAATTLCPPLMPACVFACIPLLGAPTP
ncbi:MAG: hypothetical protein P4L16_06875 [Chlamydiales bacterium]|nr:hypothetical protein [Chlamydiales bacterium]